MKSQKTKMKNRSISSPDGCRLISNNRKSKIRNFRGLLANFRRSWSTNSFQSADESNDALLRAIKDVSDMCLVPFKTDLQLPVPVTVNPIPGRGRSPEGESGTNGDMSQLRGKQNLDNVSIKRCSHLRRSTSKNKDNEIPITAFDVEVILSTVAASVPFGHKLLFSECKAEQNIQEQVMEPVGDETYFENVQNNGLKMIFNALKEPIRGKVGERRDSVKEVLHQIAKLVADAEEESEPSMDDVQLQNTEAMIRKFSEDFDNLQSICGEFNLMDQYQALKEKLDLWHGAVLKREAKSLFLKDDFDSAFIKFQNAFVLFDKSRNLDAVECFEFLHLSNTLRDNPSDLRSLPRDCKLNLYTSSLIEFFHACQTVCYTKFKWLLQQNIKLILNNFFVLKHLEKLRRKVLSNCLKISIWRRTGLDCGHASMETCNFYISFWPSLPMEYKNESLTLSKSIELARIDLRKDIRDWQSLIGGCDGRLALDVETDQIWERRNPDATYFVPWTTNNEIDDRYTKILHKNGVSSALATKDFIRRFKQSNVDESRQEALPKASAFANLSETKYQLLKSTIDCDNESKWTPQNCISFLLNLLNQKSDNVIRWKNSKPLYLTVSDFETIVKNYGALSQF